MYFSACYFLACCNAQFFFICVKYSRTGATNRENQIHLLAPFKAVRLI